MDRINRINKIQTSKASCLGVNPVNPINPVNPVYSVRHAGFTLIELLIVITIIAMGAAMVALSVSGGDARLLKEETARLSALFRIAQDEARVSGRTLVWEANLEGYRFRPLDPEAARDWRDEVLRPRAWPFAVRSIEGGRIVFGREPLLDPATLRIATAEREVRLVLDAQGELREIQ
jgi:general secretion pathway protein H